MSLLLISQAYTQLEESITDENEEVSTQNVQPVVKCSNKSNKKLVGAKKAASRKYELRKRRLDPVRSSDNLETRKVFSLKSKTISKRPCKPSSKRNVQTKLDANSTNQSKSSQNERKQKPVIDKTAVIKLERCDNLVQQSRTTTTALRETANTGKGKKRNCKIEEKPFKCTECSKEFSQLCNLREHEQIVHIGRKPIKCPTCPNAFLWKKNLDNHIKSFHSKNGEEKTKCPICFKIFSTIRNLKIHREVVHLKMRPFQCSICLKQFGAKTILKCHERCHTGEKPFECPACKKRFSRKKDLSRHQRTHDATKPFKCSICSRGFRRKYILREHIKRKHN